MAGIERRGMKGWLMERSFDWLRMSNLVGNHVDQVRDTLMHLFFEPSLYT